MAQTTTTTRLAQDKRMPVTTFLRDTFFPHAETYFTEDVEIDTRKGGQVVAPCVAPNVGGINVGRQGYETHTYKTPLIAPQKPLSKEVLKTRLIGENIESTKTPEERASAIIQKDLQDMDDSITRREELMAAQLLTTGRVEVKGYIDDKLENFIDESVDYKFNQRTILTDAQKWNTQTASRYDDCSRLCEQVMKSGYNPEYLVLGISSYKLLLQDATFLKMLDTKRLALGTIAPQLNINNGNGVKAIGRINDLGVDLYTYYAWYFDESGQRQPYIPENKVIAAPGNIGEFLYGAITQIEEDKEFHTHEGTRVPKEWTNVGSDVRMCRLSSRPLPHPYDIGGWAVLDTF